MVGTAASSDIGVPILRLTGFEGDLDDGTHFSLDHSDVSNPRRLLVSKPGALQAYTLTLTRDHDGSSITAVHDPERVVRSFPEGDLTVFPTVITYPVGGHGKLNSRLVLLTNNCTGSRWSVNEKTTKDMACFKHTENVSVDRPHRTLSVHVPHESSTQVRLTSTFEDYQSSCLDEFPELKEKYHRRFDTHLADYLQGQSMWWTISKGGLEDDTPTTVVRDELLGQSFRIPTSFLEDPGRIVLDVTPKA